MLKIGRYEIAFGWACWIQTHVPTTIRCILGFIWIFKEARPTDIDKKRRFPLGTAMFYNGKKYHYRKAGENIHVGNRVWKEAKDEDN